MSIPFYVTGDDVSITEAGLSLIIDGVVQPFSIKQDDKIIAENETMHIFNVGLNETIEFEFVFTPVVGTKGDTLGLYFVGTVAPSYMPLRESTPSFGMYHSALTTLPFSIRFGESTSYNDNYTAMTEVANSSISKDLLDSYKQDDGTNQLDYGAVFEFYQNEILETKISGKNKINLILKAYGGDAGKYRTTVFVNHKPVEVVGKDYI